MLSSDDTSRDTIKNQRQLYLEEQISYLTTFSSNKILKWL